MLQGKLILLQDNLILVNDELPNIGDYIFDNITNRVCLKEKY